MIWECSECGERVLRHRPAMVCSECGIAGVTFVRADETEPLHEVDNLRAAWLRAGMERGSAYAHLR